MTTVFIDPPVSTTDVSSAEAIDPAQPQAVPADVSASTGRGSFKKFLEDQAFIEAVMERSVPADGNLWSGGFVAQVEAVPTGLNRVVTMLRSATRGLARVLRQLKNAPVLPCAELWEADFLVARLQERQASRGDVSFSRDAFPIDGVRWPRN